MVSSVKSPLRTCEVGRAVATASMSPKKASGWKSPVWREGKAASEQRAQLGACCWLLASPQPSLALGHTVLSHTASTAPPEGEELPSLTCGEELHSCSWRADEVVFRSWWAREQNELQTSPVSYLLGVDSLILRLMGKSHI